MNWDLSSRWGFLRMALLFEGGLAVVACGLAWWLKIDLTKGLTGRPTDWAWGLGGAGPLFLAFLLSERFPLGPLRAIREFLHEALGPWLRQASWAELLLVAGMAGLGEELLFRGVLQPKLGWIWSNVAFGVAHLITPLYGVLAAACGLYLGWLLDRSGSLTAPILTHGLYDFLAFLVVARSCRRQ